MKNKVALIIPYFGKLPNYYHIWALSASQNKDFDFLVFTDNDLVSKSPNLRVINMSFFDVVERIKTRIDRKCVVSTPYKLCDYKPTYGVLFEEYLSDYDFWGFCDMDLVFGSLKTFVTDEILDSNDKLFFSGHFSLHRNNEKMNRLFLSSYPNVIDYRTALFTNYNCHFDENGTVAYANEYDNSIRFYYARTFYDADFMVFRFLHRNQEVCFRWSDGHLYMLSLAGQCISEYMYIHLQKRQMKVTTDKTSVDFYIARDRFFDSMSEIEVIKSNEIEDERYFSHRIKRLLLDIRMKKLVTGWPKMKLLSIVKHWRVSKRL